MAKQSMSIDEWNKKVDEWLKSQEDIAGDQRRAEWPPDKLGLRGGIEDKIATPDRIGDYAHMIRILYGGRLFRGDRRLRHILGGG